MTNNTHFTNLTLSDIKVDPECQARAAMDDTTIDEYAEVMKEKGYDRFPAVVVYHDGTDYWLSDGFHRYAAAEKAGLPSINARIHQGSRRDAILNSVGTNATHGLRRSNEDKRRAVAMLLGDPEWVRWSDAKIAQHCRVSDRFVAKQRKNTPNRSESDARVYIHPKSGKTTTMNTAKIGKRDGLDEVLSVEPDRDVQPDQTWLARPDTGTAKEDTVDDIADDERGPVSDLTSGTEEVELQELLSAWSRASEEVQQQFLTSIGVSPTPQDDEGSGLAETEHRQQPEPSHEPTSPQKPSYAGRVIPASRAVARRWTACGQSVGERAGGDVEWL